jgi:hypothetical protein
MWEIVFEVDIEVACDLMGTIMLGLGSVGLLGPATFDLDLNVVGGDMAMISCEDVGVSALGILPLDP